MFENLPEILKPADLAAVLQLSKNTVYNMLDKGHIKGYKVGDMKIWRINKADFLTYINRSDDNYW